MAQILLFKRIIEEDVGVTDLCFFIYLFPSPLGHTIHHLFGNIIY